MKRVVVPSCLLITVLAIAYQQVLPKVLSDHAVKLGAAQSLTATVKVTDLAGVTEDLSVTFSKPNMIKIDGPSRLIVSDGKTMTILDKTLNIYLQFPATNEDVMKSIVSENIVGWGWFFEKDSAKLVRSASAGGPRTMRGLATTEASALLVDGRTTATLFVENKSGIAKGYSLKNSEKSIIVWADEISVSDKALDAAAFAFVAPAGAKAQDVAVSSADANWGSVSNIFGTKCMPCHSAGRKSGGQDFSKYETVKSSRAITSGNPGRSRLLQLVRSGAMPQGRQMLSNVEIMTIENWILGGLKP